VRKRTALVIGAGIAGLATAYNLTRHGYLVTVLERRSVIGGLARSLKVNGQPLEVYYHFICGGDHALLALIDELGLGERLHWAPARTAYFVDGHLYPLTSPWDLLRFRPLSLRERIRLGQLILYCRRTTHWEHLEHLTAHKWLLQRLGPHAYNIVWKSLLDLKFGKYGELISAPWVWHRLHRVTRSRSNVLRPEQMGFLDGGTQVLLEALADRIEAAGGRISLNTEVTGLLTRHGRAVGVRTGDADIGADVIVAATQIPDLVRLLPEEAAGYRAQLAAINFIGIVCVMLKMSRNLTDFFWVNSNDRRIPCNGFIEYSNLNPSPQFGGSAIVYFPFYSEVSAPLFSAPDEEIVTPLIDSLSLINPELSAEMIEQVVVTRDPYGQAICPPHFSRQVPAIATPIPNLYLLDSTQLYPSDRCLSGMIGLADRLAAMLR